MTYRELIELYKQGKLEEEKRKEVEYDIEKQDAISEYLFDRDEIEVFDFLNNEEQNQKNGEDANKNFAKMINRSIRRAFIKMGAVVTALILIAVLFIQFGMPKAVSSYYYNPNKMIGEYTNQMSLDMAVYTELLVPGYRRDVVFAIDNGYGNYEFTVHQENSYNGTFTDVSGKINKNKLVFYNSNIIKRPASNIFEWSNPDIKPSGFITEQMKQMKAEFGEDNSIHFEYSIIPEEAKKMLDDLEEDKIYNAYVSLDKIMDYEEFVNFIETYDNLEQIWCAPVVSDNMERVEVENIGFNYRYGGMHYIEWDKKKYPNLQIWEDEEGVKEENLRSESFAISHFTDMIKYMCDQKEFCKMIDENCVNREMAEYVKENGLKIYGFQTITEKKDLQKLMDAKEVYTINVEEIK